MSQPKPKRPPRLQDSATGWKQITDIARRLKFQKELAHSQSKRVRKAVGRVAKMGLSQKPQKQQRFLDRVLEISPEYFLLCAIALSQNLVAYMKDAVLDRLLDTIAKNKKNDAIIRPDIRSYAIDFQIPGAVQLARQNETLSALQEASRRDGTVAEVVMSDAEDDPDNETDRSVGSSNPIQEEQVFGNASLGGIENVIDESMCDAIRGVTADSDSTNITPPNETQSDLTAVPGISSNDPNFTTAQRAVATFEGVIFFAAESIPGSKEREAWIFSCLDHLHVLKRLSCVNEGDGRSLKRKRGAGQEGQPNASDGCNHVIRARSIETTEAQAAVNRQAGNAPSLDSSFSQSSIRPIYQGGAIGEASPRAANFEVVPQAQNVTQIEASDMNMALMAEVGKLKSILGNYLFTGMKLSHIRRREEDSGSMLTDLTDTVRLRLPHRSGEDFKLEVWLCSSFGESIPRAIMSSVEELRIILGDYLFDAMNASNWRKEEKTMGKSACTGAVGVSFPSGKGSSSDSKLEVMLNFETGLSVYRTAYPS
ncbi:hypothetical protein K469DRAFT_755231 [Zopfia rhizophila CBS 207.26]|uniref:Uncharacterized protein n=1 Tax=Zopfia rhizophila CBS 207.26 TaxID=1314779 RepID=A0A6A6DGD8_9PEZI|nr:hypothetical protein K469DRAFT_755231 [Zopfia rhizophila CBS 207.26]